jgi:magnesium chelatase family protein
VLDRIDLAVRLLPVPGAEWAGGAAGGEDSAAVRARVATCRSLQRARYAAEEGSRTNGHARLPLKDMAAAMSAEARSMLGRAADRMGLSGRVLAKACRVARTIADLGGDAAVGEPHLAEALQYRLPGPESEAGGE